MLDSVLNDTSLFDPHLSVSKKKGDNEIGLQEMSGKMDGLNEKSMEGVISVLMAKQQEKDSFQEGFGFKRCL